MKIIIVKQDHSRTRSFRVNVRKLVLSASLTLSVSAVLGGTVIYSWMSLENRGMLTEEGLENWKQALAAQEEKLANVRSDTRRQMDALTLRLAQLQGRITRLDALGERLTARANLDDGEFNFDEPPALGGPEEPLDGEQVYSRPSLVDAIEQLAQQIESRERQLDLLDSLLANRTIDSESFLSGMPSKTSWISSRFGQRTDPFTGAVSWHNGVDFAGKKGSDIFSVGAGVVTWASDRGGFGYMVEINHGNGYVTRYAHNDSIIVSVGDIVTKGQVIAKMGNTGRSTGTHLHFEVLKNGRHVDPASYMYRARKKI